MAKGGLWNQLLPGLFNSCSLQTYGKALLLKMTVKYFIKPGEVKLVPTTGSTLMTSIHGTGKVLCIYHRKKVTTNPSTNPVAYSGDLSGRYAGSIVAQTLWEKPTTLWLDLRPTPWDGTHVWHAWVAKNPRLDRPWALGQKQTLLFYWGTWQQNKIKFLLCPKISTLLSHHQRSF